MKEIICTLASGEQIRIWVFYDPLGGQVLPDQAATEKLLSVLKLKKIAHKFARAPRLEQIR